MLFRFLAGLRELVRRRGQGEPVAYILGYKDFYNHRFEVNSATLIPRPETELLVEEILKWAKASENKDSLSLIDLGCGTGCIGLSLLKEIPHAKLLAVDVSEKALEVAQRNAAALEVLDRVRFVNADATNVDLVMSSFKDFMRHDKVDVLVSNPPYIATSDSAVQENVRKYEPSSALFADEEGLALLKNWSKTYAPYLKEHSLMLMEMGMTQAAAMQSHFQDLKIFDQVRVIKDLAGLDRVIYGVKHG